MWLARNKKGYLNIHSKKPVYKEGSWLNPNCNFWDDESIYIDRNEFPEITFENSPMEINSLEIAGFRWALSKRQEFLNNASLDLMDCLNEEKSRKELIAELKRRMLFIGIQKRKPNAPLWYGNFQFAMNEDCTGFELTFPIRYVTSLDELGEIYTLSKCPLKFIKETLKLNPSK